METEAYNDKYEKAFVCWVRYLTRMDSVARVLGTVFDWDGNPIITQKEITAYRFWESKLYGIYIESLYYHHRIELKISRRAMMTAVCLNYSQRIELIESFNKELEEVGGQ